ncbi:MAG: hypothetical protein JJU28_10985 [Cyclobacteriaceae bacterium]|nr:hypothetical protein [Cyclobacteriaceae bacterium]
MKKQLAAIAGPAIGLCLLLAACQTHDNRVYGDLSVIIDTASVRGAGIQGMDGGGLRRMQQKSVEWKDLHCTFENQKITAETYAHGAGISMVPEALGFKADWRDYSHLWFHVENLSEEDLQLFIKVKGMRNILTAQHTLEKGKKEWIELSLYDLALAAINLPLYQPNNFTLEFGNKSSVKVRIHAIAMERAAKNFRGPVSDRFGQRITGNWTGKVIDSLELNLHKAEEEKQLSKVATIWQDTFGGWANGPQLQATGFFRIEEHNEKWWFVTPQGNLFWSLGVTGVRPRERLADVTLVKGREEIFEWLPAKDGDFAEVWVDEKAMSFYHVNLLRKYGKLEAWRKTTLQRLKNWGLNSIGNWSEDSLVIQSDVPFTYSFRTRFEGLSHAHGLSDVFDPEWERKTDSVLSAAAIFKDNPYLIGYFVDNEAGWGAADFPDFFPDDCATRFAFEAMLKRLYPSPQAVSKQWEFEGLNSWDDIRNARFAQFAKNKALADDLKAFETLFAEKYFKTIKNNLQKHDPNHLYMSCRFTRRLKPLHILEVAGRYSDVITVNVYAYAPIQEEMDAWYKATGRPILIGEHHVALLSERQHPPHWQAFTADERESYYYNYVKTWASFPYALGSHWYQFVDQAITGRSTDGENQVVGMVDITDQPYQHLIRTARHLSDSIYHWHDHSLKSR